MWEIINLTGDTHPIHFHLVNVQVLSRQPFDADNVRGRRPDATRAQRSRQTNELGWKETVRMNPGEVTRVLMKFDLPAVPFTVPAARGCGRLRHQRRRVRLALPHPRARRARHDAAARRHRVGGPSH